MIEKVVIHGYRKFRDLTFVPHPHFNILVGENESGKSTLLEAMVLALTGRINGRAAAEELNPYWFNTDEVSAFFAALAAGETPALPTISIEVFLADRDEFQRWLFGANNSEEPTRDCAGVCLIVEPDPDYSTEIWDYLGNAARSLLPVEYYRVEWRTFSDTVLTRRPKELITAVIDSDSTRAANGVDYHLRSILKDRLSAPERAAVSLAFRAVKEKMTAENLGDVNTKLAELDGTLYHAPVSLAMDQSAQGSWDASVVPHVAALPFGMAGQGQQAVVKTVLAMGRNASAGVVMIEEPDNHLSHTSLNWLITQIEMQAGQDQQVFITTHSSFVLNRLGLNNLQLVNDGRVSGFSDLSPDTVAFFQKQAGFDTLRIVLAEKVVLVEGPSDEIVFERAFRDVTKRRPIDDGIDVISMRGLSLKRGLELARATAKKCAVLRDNDNVAPATIIGDIDPALLGDDRRVFIGDVVDGMTLEPQLITANGESHLRKIFGLSPRQTLLIWMTNNKTDAALQLLETSEVVSAPQYFLDAIAFIRA